jgi:putative addiction module component (TIGR02574 family)
MKSTPLLSEALALPVPDRIALVEAIWESIAESGEVLALSPEQEAELDRRMEEYRKNPDSGIPWNTVKAELARKFKAG